MKEFDADELAGFNGENGNPTYIAYDGKVYDVSESKLWRNGQHMDDTAHPVGDSNVVRRFDVSRKHASLVLYVIVQPRDPGKRARHWPAAQQAGLDGHRYRHGARRGCPCLRPSRKG